MEYNDAKEVFVKNWGDFAVNWGASKSLGQIHALLLISNKPICADDIMEELGMSRGCVNMNLRNLVEWQLIFKQHITESRKEFFEAEKDIWKVFCCIVTNRKKKELDPMIEILKQMEAVQACCPESKEFVKTINDLQLFSSKADNALENITKSQPNFLVSAYLKMLG